MPTPYLRRLAKQSGLSVEEVRAKLQKAKQQAEKTGYANDTAYINRIAKRMCGVNESIDNASTADQLLEALNAANPQYDSNTSADGVSAKKYQKAVPLLGEGLTWVPKPFITGLEWAIADALVNNPDLLRNIQPSPVLMDDKIEATQAARDQAVVDKYALSGNTQGGLAFERNGTIFIFDGHHRFYAAQQNHEPITMLKVLRLGDTDGSPADGMTLEQFAQQLGVRRSSIVKAMDISVRRHYETGTV